MTSAAPVIKAVLFDAAGTLLHVHPGVGEVYAEASRAFGVTVDADALDQAFRKAWKTLRPARTPDALVTSEQIERAWWRDTAEAVFREARCYDAFNGRFEAFFEILFERFAEPGVWRFFDDVMPALDALKARGLRLAVVSNWDARLHRLLDAMDERHHFDVILTSAEVGRRKPHPRPFTSACELLAVEPCKALHIGDSPEDDIAGAQAAGVHPLLLNRAGRTMAGNEIATLCEITAYLDRRERLDT